MLDFLLPFLAGALSVLLLAPLVMAVMIACSWRDAREKTGRKG